jgi:hypothetical protein
MSEETTRTDGWGPTDPTGTATQGNANAGTESRIGFCQDCGKPLTPSTVRNVGTGVFCEPCLTARVGTPNPAPGYTTVPPYAPIPPSAALPGDPRPGLAALLGIIPGVGAMYNGQFAKGIAHIAIFAVLVSLSDNVNGIFGLFVAGWIVYMAFEAHHTAIARRDGLPLPNAFGLNDIGERLGFGKGWGNVTTVRPAAAAAPPSDAASPYAPVPPASTTDWVGYVPPTAYGAAAAQQEAYAASMAANVQAQAMRDATYYSQSPYAQTYTGTEYTAPSVGPIPVSAIPVATIPVPEIQARRFPTGALWLIGLGILILLANLLPDWHYSERWWLPILFAGLSVWTFTRRMNSGARLICIIRWPILFMILAIMFALHALNLEVTVGLTLSILLIAFGALLLLERTAGAGPTYSAPYTASVVPGYTPAEEAPGAAWTSTTESAAPPIPSKEENQ